MKTIYQLLGLSLSEYEDLLIQNWFEYCSSFADNPTQHAMLIASSSLYRYYQGQYSWFENEFLIAIEKYEREKQGIEVLDYCELYGQYTFKVHNRRCMPLINEAKQREVKPISKTNVKGVKQIFSMN